MEYIRYILISIIIFTSTSCEYNLLRFGWTDYTVNERFNDSQAYNKTHPAKCLETESDEYFFTVTSDYHLEKDSACLPKFFKYINSSKSTFVTLNGDLYNSYEEYANFAHSALTNGIKIPAYYTAGNHDQYFGWKIFYDRWGASTYRFTVTTPKHKDLYIVLETGSSTLGKDQYNWLSDMLDQRNNYRYCIILTHSNFTYQGFRNGVFTQEETIMLYDLFARNNVNMVISGHSHRENDVDLEGVRYITTGAMENGEFGTCYVNKSGISFRFEDL